MRRLCVPCVLLFTAASPEAGCKDPTTQNLTADAKQLSVKVDASAADELPDFPWAEDGWTPLPKLPPPRPGEPSLYREVANAQQLYGNKIGIVGLQPRAVRAFLSILADRRARHWFSMLTGEGSLPGRLYGLCGLYRVDRRAFNVRRKAFLSIDTRITVGNGCMVTTEPVSQIVTEERRKGSRGSFLGSFNMFCESLR